MPTPYEQRLLEMSRRANAVDPSTEPQLPDLNLQALLSPQAAFEVTAAQMLATPPVDLVRQQGRQMRERIAAQQDADAAHLIQQAPALPSLESIFLANAAREIGMDQADAMAFATASANDFGIDYGYDMDADLTERAVPNESARFQVGRESPPHRPFSASREMQDGVVVGQRVGGRFETVGRRPEPVRREALQRVVYGAQAVRAPAPIVSVDTSPGPVMSALDVVSGDSFDNI